MFLRNAWYVGATRSEITEKPLARTLLNEPVVLYRDKSGTACALEDRCCHRAAPLSLGEVTDRGLMCGYHGLVFDGSGTCVHIPGQEDRIPKKARVRSYPVLEKMDAVWIWMGDEEKADPALIPNYPPDDPTWPREYDMLHVKASYLRVLENLMDLSHLSYVHKNTIGSAKQDSANAMMQIDRTQTGVKFLRLMRNATPPAYWVKRCGYKGLIDRWADFEFVGPNNILQTTGGVDAGEFDKGTREGGMLVRIIHSVTPETDTTCFYFFSVADGYARFETEAFPYRGPSVSDIFKEDVVMMEAQQKMMNGYDMSKLVDTKDDAARIQMLRFLEQQIQRERELASAGAERA